MSGEIDYFLLDQLRRHEGFRAKAYKCPSGKLSIGYGRNIEDNGITEQEAEFLLNNDLMNSRKELHNAFPWYDRLSLRRKQALINLHFNIGLHSLWGFVKFLTAMEQKDWQKAHDELLDSKYARQVGGRANELAAQILEG